jgi:hypothetical protein
MGRAKEEAYDDPALSKNRCSFDVFYLRSNLAGYIPEYRAL